MSAYARSSVLPPARGVHRFGQRRSEDRSESGGNGILPADPTAPSTIQIREEYPFSQITMSQGSASFVDESAVESTAATNRRSGDKRGNDAVLPDRAARWRLTRRELERGQKRRRSTPSNDKIPMGIAEATPGRRDKRSRISLNEMTRLGGANNTNNNDNDNTSTTIRKGAASQSRRFLSSATKVPSVPPRSTLARGMSVLGRVMTPLRTAFPRRPLLLRGKYSIVDDVTAKSRGRTTNEPSPLDRPKPTTSTLSWNREKKDGSDDATKTSCSTYDPNPPRRSTMTTVDSDSKETTMEDATTTEIAEGARNSSNCNETNKQDGETYLIQIKEMLSQMQQTKWDVEEWKRGMEEQRIALETRYQNGFERQQQQQQELDALKINVAEELKTYRDEIIKEREALDDQKAQLSEFQCTIRKEMRDLKAVVASSSDRNRDLSRVQDAKVDAIAELRQFVEESKARIGVCGKLEMEALEGESRAVKRAIREIVDGAKSEIELKRREVVEEVEACWTDFKMHIDTFTLKTLEKKEKEETADASVGNSPNKEENAKSPVKLTTSSPESSPRETSATTFTNGTAEESNEDDSTYDDDGSLLNNSSLAPVPLKRNPTVKKAPTKAATLVHSIRTAPRDTTMSVSTTPFSRKATPRIQNSYIKRQRKPTKYEGPSRKSTHFKAAEFALSVVVNGKKTKAASEISSPRGKDMNSAKAICDTDKTTPLVESKKAVSSNKKTKTPSQTDPAKGNKRSRSDFDPIKSPRRSKRVREAARVEQKQALEAALSQNSTASRNVTPKEGDMTSPPIARRRTAHGKSPSPAVSFQSNAKTPSSNGTDTRNDRLLGKSVVVMADRRQEIGDLDGCESIVPKDDVLAGPLSVPWGVRGSGSKSRKKSYSIGRKRDRKPFSFDAIGSIFEFKF